MLGRPSVCDVLAGAWFSAVIVLVALVWRDYAVTWDEHWHMVYGDLVLEWFRGESVGALSYRTDYLYGGAFDLLGAVARRVSPLAPHETMHALIACTGIVGLVGAWRLGRRLGGPGVGLAALVLLTLTPSWWGHMFNNPKDIPFAVGYVWAVDALVAAVQRFPRFTYKDAARLGLFLGLACCVRVGGLILVALFVAAVAAFCVARAWQRRRAAAGIELVASVGPRVATTVAVAWAVMIAAWPWAQRNPLGRPLIALFEMTHFSGHRRMMPFAGTDIHTTDPRMDYLVHYFGFKLPVLVLALVAIAIVYALLRRRWDRGWCILAVAAVVPPLFASMANSILYDGLRHFLFVVPLAAVAAAAGTVALRAWWKPIPLLVGAAVLGGGWLGWGQVRAMIDLHPHQYVFFNRIAGGLPGAFGRYSTDYYGTSYKDAFAELFEHLWRTERDVFLDSDYVVAACMPKFVGELYLAPNARWSGGPGNGPDPDFHIGYTRGGCHNKYPTLPVVLTVERQGTVLNVVREMRR